jgi:hypothetical protein
LRLSLSEYGWPFNASDMNPITRLIIDELEAGGYSAELFGALSESPEIYKVRRKPRRSEAFIFLTLHPNHVEVLRYFDRRLHEFPLNDPAIREKVLECVEYYLPKQGPIPP